MQKIIRRLHGFSLQQAGLSLFGPNGLDQVGLGLLVNPFFQPQLFSFLFFLVNINLTLGKSDKICTIIKEIMIQEERLAKYISSQMMLYFPLHFEYIMRHISQFFQLKDLIFLSHTSFNRELFPSYIRISALHCIGKSRYDSILDYFKYHINGAPQSHDNKQENDLPNVMTVRLIIFETVTL